MEGSKEVSCYLRVERAISGTVKKKPVKLVKFFIKWTTL